ncbi:beta-ketoacyl-[acyl-carrier-protein] synthase family protein [Actinocorallia libanotica]|uniref:Beta-ketoacyl-[acyl-carrier-protein] synthase family protein n=1 Tax=Actinocorallia libanotica TaxID=46162 RepID=A0ABN1RPD4_9ACTN
MKKTRVVVTGLGATTPLGGDVASTWKALLAGESGARNLPWKDVDALPVRFAASAAVEPAASGRLSPERLERLDRSQAFALIAAMEAMADAGHEAGLDPDRLGVVVSSGIGGLHSALDGYDTLREKGWAEVSPLAPFRQPPNGPAVQVGREFDARAGVHTLVSACASGSEAIGYGAEMIRNGRADVVIAGGSEACIHPLQMAAFGAMRAMSTRNGEPATASRPFDKSRDGFVLGEGAAVLVLESEESALARGARVYAVAAGVGYSAEGHDIVQPSTDGRGAAKAMTRCLADADLVPSEVVAVNAHATGTPLGDVAEINGIRTAFGTAAGGLAITASKSMTGHLLGGAGALGALVAVLALHEGLLPPVAHLADLDDAIDLDIVTGAPRPLPAGPAAALSNAVGFGGHNAVLAFTRP